ncbi:MAG: hypothetical protein ACTSPY_03965 [Candidatus Helarchaeota archaeon]
MCAVWKISPGKKGAKWENFLQCECMSMGNYGIYNLDNIANYKNKKELRGKFISISGANQLWKFYTEISYNDIIIAYSNRHIYGLGVVIGDYKYIFGCECWEEENYIRKVKWVDFGTSINVKNDKKLFGNPPKYYGILNKILTLIEISDEDWNYILENYKEIEKAYIKLRGL